MDHIHPPDHQQINAVLTRPAKKSGGERRAGKRKGDDESSYSSDEEAAATGQPVRKRYPVLSPASSSCQSSVLAGSPKAGNEVDSDSAGGTVKELEQAMSKHLPPPDKTTSHTDFSTDALLKAQQRSTIQWIGALQQPGASLPASTLLRQLYANRESVIRANVSSRGGGGYYGPEMVGPLPTPPGSEGGSYPPQDYNGLYPNYSAVDYHSAMTPPSSVSPRDKHQQPMVTPSGGFDSPPVGAPFTHDMLRSQYLDQPLPLKPQPYPPSVHPLEPYPTTSLEQPQFYPSNPPPAFHLYNKPNTASPNWYTAPS
uniref:Protein trachealess n=2 Tax=Lygus hesperus TaxID=30085 RepID=A0A0A9X7K1_LYGHE